MIQQTFQNILNKEKIDKEVVTLVTQVVVDKHPSLKNPTKFVGKRFSKQEAEKRAKNMGWIVKEQDFVLDDLTWINIKTANNAFARKK